MENIGLDMIQTAGIGALALVTGMVLTRKLAFLQKFCVPSPVSGGILFSLLALALYGWLGLKLSFDNTLKDVFMLAFFTSVGFQSDLRVIRQGGRPLVIMLMFGSHSHSWDTITTRPCSVPACAASASVPHPTRWQI